VAPAGQEGAHASLFSGSQQSHATCARAWPWGALTPPGARHGLPLTAAGPEPSTLTERHLGHPPTAEAAQLDGVLAGLPRRTVTAVGLEPAPLQNGALSHRLRPLGQTVMSHICAGGPDYVRVCR